MDFLREWNDLRWTEEQYETWVRKTNFTPAISSAVRPANVEPGSSDAARAPDGPKEIHPRFRVRFHSRRRRLIDPDGLYTKAALDGLVRGAILPDDSAQWIQSVTYRQERTHSAEETVIEVEMIR